MWRHLATLLLATSWELVSGCSLRLVEVLWKGCDRFQMVSDDGVRKRLLGTRIAGCGQGVARAVRAALTRPRHICFEPSSFIQSIEE